MKTPMTIALSNGRILQETLPLLAHAGIVPETDMTQSRKLVFATNVAGLRLLLLRATDVPTYVQYGVADLGVAGKDVLLEHGAQDMYELLDLEIARCQLMTAVLQGVTLPTGRIRVATKFVNVARRYFAERGQQVDLIKLYGGMELAPVLGLADCIVDIVDTGNTLRANGLEPLATIAPISSRLLASRVGYKTKSAQLQPIVAKLGAAVVAARPTKATRTT